MKKKPVKKSYLLAGGMALLVTALVFLNFYVLYRTAVTNRIAAHMTKIDQAADEVTYFFMEAADVVQLSAYTVNSMQEEGKSSADILHYITEESDVYQRSVDADFAGLYGVFDGVYLDGIGWVPDPGYIPEERPWYLSAMEKPNEVALVSPYLDMQTDTVMMSLARSLPDRKSVISLDISLNGLQELINRKQTEDDWEDIMVLDDKGFVVAHSDESKLGVVYSEETGTLERLIYDRMAEEDEHSFQLNYGGSRYQVFCAQATQGWYTVAVMRLGTLLKPLHSIYLVMAVTVFAFFAVVFFLIRKERREGRVVSQLVRQIKAVAGVFETAHLIDLSKDTYYEVSAFGDDVLDVVKIGGDQAQVSIRSEMDIRTDERFKKAIFDFINFSTLQERLEGKNGIAWDFINSKNRRCRGRFVPVEWTEEGKLKSVLWIVEYLDGGNDSP